ncbi:hypothetical protein V2S66_29200 [Streptomyces sp. V4-01]|uniref:Uncharacterized protein n=1 Tax=Actinacidiphila polyblastidii TaxID=3110430 RepID=A0ABU7PJM1_9ACTN|nr:hypothetical protein [Streptomyces sp. V4-01]
MLEVAPSGLAALTRFGPGVEQLDSLTRAGRVPARRLRLGDRGRELFAHGLFTSWSAAVLLVAALRG